MKRSPPILSLHQLIPGYAGTSSPLFEPLSIGLAMGELVCLLGANGSGKSTLIRTIAGLQRPLSGTLNFQNEPKSRHLPIAVVLTDPVRISNMTVRELITYGRYPYLSWNIRLGSEDTTIVEDAMAKVNVQALADRNLDELSDGQRQMAMIARALAQETPVLLLDEPTAHLDAGNRVAVMRFLKSLAKTIGKAILMATHEIDLALQTADRLWLVHNQKIITGIPEDLILQGAVDELFPIAGYDLKTGRILHETNSLISISLTGGNDTEFRWTKNALERNGYEVSENGRLRISIDHSPTLRWRREDLVFSSIAELLLNLEN